MVCTYVPMCLCTSLPDPAVLYTSLISGTGTPERRRLADVVEFVTNQPGKEGEAGFDERKGGGSHLTDRGEGRQQRHPRPVACQAACVLSGMCAACVLSGLPKRALHSLQKQLYDTDERLPAYGRSVPTRAPRQHQQAGAQRESACARTHR